MKKKFLSFIMAMCLIVPCAFIMTACGGNDEPPKPSVQSSKANVLNVDYSYDEQSDCITFLMTDTINLQKSDFEIVQTYTDNTTKTLDTNKWILDLSEIPSAPESNSSYRIVFKYADKDEEIDSINITFIASQINTLDFELQPYSITYTGEEIDVVDMIDEYLTSQQQVSLTSLIESGVVIVSTENNSTRTATNSGEYFVEFAPANGYEWTAGDSSSKYVNWRINMVEIPAPTLVNNSLDYDYEIEGGYPVGLAQEVEYVFGNFDNALQFVDINNNVEDARFTTSATSVGYYSVRFDIKEEFAQNYTFDFGTYTSNSCVLEWEINCSRVIIPTLIQSIYTYNPNGFNPIEAGNLHNYDSSLMTLTNYAGDIPQADSYSNYITAELKDTENFVWDLGCGTTDPQRIEFIVNKADVELPNGFDESKLKMVATWNEYITLSHLIPSLDEYSLTNTYWTDEAVEYMFDNGFEYYHSLLWASDIAETNLTEAGAGVHTFTMLYRPNINYNAKELNVTVEILKQKLCINYYLSGNDSYSPEHRVYTAQSLDITMESMAEQINVESYATDVIYSIGYKETENGEYVYNDYTQEQFNSIEGNLGMLMEEAGYYDLKVSVTADGNHLFYDVYKDEDTATQVCELHQPVVIYPHEVTMWMALEHKLDSDYYNYSSGEKQRFYYKDGQSINYEIENFNDLADTTTLIYVNRNTKSLVTNTMSNLPTCTTYYRASESDEWVEATNTSEVGFYKNKYTFTPIDTKNIVAVPFELEWEIMPANVNFDSIGFEGFTNPTYSGDSVELPTFRAESIPESVIKSGYTYKTGTGYSNELYGWEIMEVGDYLTSWWFRVPNNVTVTYRNEEITFDMFTITTDGDYTTYNYNLLWSVEKYTLTAEDVNFDSYTNNQELQYTGSKLSPVYEIDFIKDFDVRFKYNFDVSKTTKQDGVEVEAINVGSYETTIVVEIDKDSIILDEEWKESLTGLTEDEYSYYITITINWSIVDANA